MRGDSSGIDPRTVWQNQPAEPSIMTLEKIRQKTKELQAKTRRALFGGIVVSLLVAGLSGYGIVLAGSPVTQAVFVVAVAWSLAGQYFLNRGMWSEGLPEDAALRTGLLSYRREVERRRHLSGRVLWWSFGPVLVAVGALIALIIGFGIVNRGMPLAGTLRKMLPFLTLMLLWIVGIFVLRVRDRRQLQREIEDLNAIEKANG